MPERFPDDAAATGEGVPAASLPWEAYFTAPDLQRLARAALACNRDLRMASLQVQVAASAQALQHAALRPSLSFTLDRSRLRESAELNLSARVSWELDLWGRLAALDEAALQAWLASDANRKAMAAALVAQVAERYLALRELDERIGLAESALATRTESLRIFRLRYAVGATTRLDLSQVESLQAQAASLLLQLRSARARESHALGQLTGGDMRLDPQQGRFDDLLILAPLAQGLPSDLLLARPDIVAAEHQLRAAHASVAAARAAYFPRIVLTGAYGSASNALGSLLGASSAAWDLGGTLTGPLLDGGRNRASREAAEVQRAFALARYERLAQNAFREVADALSDHALLAAQLRVGREALAAQSLRARLARLRYEKGAVTYLDVLDAQRDLLQLEQQQVQLRRALLSNQVSLYLALGGGTDAGDYRPACAAGGAA
jgi:NodT family efflux transporter outer membrane factor (OMF) lipoprotein